MRRARAVQQTQAPSDPEQIAGATPPPPQQPQQPLAADAPCEQAGVLHSLLYTAPPPSPHGREYTYPFHSTHSPLPVTTHASGLLGPSPSPSPSLSPMPPRRVAAAAAATAGE
ncbi:uncharacterized protein EKO05_0001048 [Ascochyta rabiei]|uniref:Uncharacterized protein n=1 Tax=Didymella rabiei TaxID=5454 RepID=A0A163EQA1_DIDRA|nr:uncharacterized protein EKO05_0001048 [Ascochyta rabiei]KZM23841.1 hypothetical protein ST47_g5017 [Ascochyta rabiei]UPX10385.1 hypothetical protein EKO05_0001048 [Ascochyta rabiei]